jgi:hypothetical protein
VFTARYALSPYIKQIRFVFKGLSNNIVACGLQFHRRRWRPTTLCLLLYCPSSPSGRSTRHKRFFKNEMSRLRLNLDFRRILSSRTVESLFMSLGLRSVCHFSNFELLTDFYKIWCEYTVGGHASLLPSNFLQWITIWRTSEVGATLASLTGP